MLRKSLQFISLCDIAARSHSLAVAGTRTSLMKWRSEAQWNENGRMDGWTVTAECGRQLTGRPDLSLLPAGKERSFTPRGQGSFNPLALHFAQPLPLPRPPVHLPGVGALRAWSEKSCLLRLHFHINCPPALLPDAAPNLEGRVDGSTARRRRSREPACESSTRTFDSRISRNQKVHFPQCTRARVSGGDAIMALLPWKDMHRFTLPPRFLGPLSRAPPPPLPP